MPPPLACLTALTRLSKVSVCCAESLPAAQSVATIQYSHPILEYTHYTIINTYRPITGRRHLVDQSEHRSLRLEEAVPLTVISMR